MPVYGGFVPTDIVPVTPNDSTDLPFTGYGLRVGADGDVSVVTGAGETRTIPMKVGQVLPLVIARVRATGTDATGIMVFKQ